MCTTRLKIWYHFSQLQSNEAAAKTNLQSGDGGSSEGQKFCVSRSKIVLHEAQPRSGVGEPVNVN